MPSVSESEGHGRPLSESERRSGSESAESEGHGRPLSELERRSRSELDGRQRSQSDYWDHWVSPEPSYVHAMSTTGQFGPERTDRTERTVSFHQSEIDMNDMVSGSIANSRRSEDLLVDLEPELVRGATMGNILRRFGKEWRLMKKNERVQWTPSLSRQIKRYHFFFSHDWRTSGWLKYLTLLIYFNGRAAAIATLIVSIAIGVLGGFEILERGEHWFVVCHSVGVFFLLFWQHLRELLYPQIGFLDRMVVPQDDPEKKSKCIYGLASFLHKSDNLIVLWSPIYFSRLWCMYEIACFLMRRKQADRIHFCPVHGSILWVLVYLAISSNWIIFYIASRDDVFSWYDISGMAVLGVVIGLQAFVIYPPIFWIMNQMLHDISLLPKQLREFNIEAAKCYCCSNGHRLSSTGDPIQCDRELIYGVLQLWSGSASMDEGSVEQIQRVFKNHLDRHLVKSVEKSFTQSSFLLRPLMSAVAIASFAFLPDFISLEFTQLIKHWPWAPPIRNSGFVVYMLAWSPIFTRLVLMLGNCGKSFWRRRRCCRFFLVLVQALFTFIIGILFVGVYFVLNGTAPYSFNHPLDAYPLFFLAFTVLVSCFLMRHLCSCRKSVMIGGTPKRNEPRQELRFENSEGEAKEVEREAEDEGSEIMPMETILSEASSFGI